MRTTTKVRVKRTARAIPEIMRIPGQRLRDVVFHADDTAFDVNEWSHPDAYVQRTFDEFARLVELGLEGRPAKDLICVRQLMGRRALAPPPSRLLLSDLRIRKQAYKLLYQHLAAVFAAPTGTPRRWFFVTVFDDVGNALEYNTVIEFERVRNKVRKTLAKLQLNAIAFIEVQAAQFPQEGCGRSLMTHAHAIGYTDDLAYSPTKAVRAARMGSMLKSWLGAPTVKMRSLASLGQLRRDCAYLCKAPEIGKRLVPDPRQPSGYRLGKLSIDPPMALRLAEVLAQVDYGQAAVATGQGLDLKNAWLVALRKRSGSQRSPRDVDAVATFARIWADKRFRRQRAPAEIRIKTPPPLSSSWENAMRDLFVKVEANREDYLGRRRERQRRRCTGRVIATDEL